MTTVATVRSELRDLYARESAAIEQEFSVKIVDDLVGLHDNRTIRRRTDFQGTNTWIDNPPLMSPVFLYIF